MPDRLPSWLRRATVPLAAGQPSRVFIALASLLAWCTLEGWTTAVIPLYLGVIASALAETDDTWRGRVSALGVTLVMFAAAVHGVDRLITMPWLFVMAIAAAAFGLTMVGALQARYKSIGFATLALAVYATLGLDGQAPGSLAREREPWLLLAGAAWYGVLSIVAAALLPMQPVQQQLSRLFLALSAYLRHKAALFEPLRDVDISRKRLVLAQLNAEVVAELNAAKESLLRRLRPLEPGARLARYRGLYLIAQDVHERASSSHDDYGALAEAFFHSDLLYRCQRVLMLQGDACGDLAKSIAGREEFVADLASIQALDELRSAIAYQRAQGGVPAQVALLASVDALAQNLASLDAQLAGASEPLAQMGRTDMGLSDTNPRRLRDMVTRVRRQLKPGSALFRHACRLAIALSVAYGVASWIHPAQAYWILLTTLFVSRQSYGDTVARLTQRTAGTVVGVVLGWALLQLFPQPGVEAILAVAAGVIFFAARVERYLVATAAITVLVLLCSNQVGHGAVLIVPRLIDTVIGGLIAWTAVRLVFPHWQSRGFSDLAAAALRGQADYLSQMARQYREGARDDLDYRIARRNAHDADAALSTAVVDMYREPGRMRPLGGVALRFLIQSHTMLNYISALGAHRAALPASSAAESLFGACESVASALRGIAAELTGAAVPPDSAGEAGASEFNLEPPADESSRLVVTELALIRQQIGSLEQLAREWVVGNAGPAPAVSRA